MNLDLNALEDSSRIVTLGDTDYRARTITKRVAELIDVAGSTDDSVAMRRAFYDATALIVPTMPRETVDNLTPAQVLAIIQLAQRVIPDEADAAASSLVAASEEAPVA